MSAGEATQKEMKLAVTPMLILESWLKVGFERFSLGLIQINFVLEKVPNYAT